jgi:predicted methyltransferase MtxX (methanogen marker protein 4)
MSLAEARGYVRVRVAHLVREEVDAAIRQSKLATTSRTHLEEMAMEVVLRQAILDLLNARKITHAAASKSVAKAA